MRGCVMRVWWLAVWVCVGAFLAGAVALVEPQTTEVHTITAPVSSAATVGLVEPDVMARDITLATTGCTDYSGNVIPCPLECEIISSASTGYFFATNVFTIEIFVDTTTPGCEFDEVRFTGVNQPGVFTVGPFDGFSRSQECSNPQDLQFEVQLLLNGSQVSPATPTLINMDFIANCEAATT